MKSLSKKIKNICKKLKIRLKVKRNGKLVYKSKRVLMKQIRKKVSRKNKRKGSHKRRSRFGAGCGCGKPNAFGKSNRNIKKLYTLCKIYKVSTRNKKPSVLRKQCLKKAKMMLRKIQKRSRFGNKRSKFGSIFSILGLRDSESSRRKALEEENRAKLKLAEVSQIKAAEVQGRIANEVALEKLKLEKQKQADQMRLAQAELRIKEKAAEAERNYAAQNAKRASEEAKKKQDEADKAAKRAEEEAKKKQKADEKHENVKAEGTQFGKRRRRIH
jgi:hypothetical protein